MTKSTSSTTSSTTTTTTTSSQFNKITNRLWTFYSISYFSLVLIGYLMSLELLFLYQMDQLDEADNLELFEDPIAWFELKLWRISPNLASTWVILGLLGYYTIILRFVIESFKIVRGFTVYLVKLPFIVKKVEKNNKKTTTTTIFQSIYSYCQYLLNKILEDGISLLLAAIFLFCAWRSINTMDPEERYQMFQEIYNLSYIPSTYK